MNSPSKLELLGFVIHFIPQILYSSNTLFLKSLELEEIKIISAPRTFVRENFELLQKFISSLHKHTYEEKGSL